MFEDVSDITIAYEEDGIQVVEELDREVISKGGAWVTILFKYHQWEARQNGYGNDRYTIRRYRKLNGEYRQQNKFNISSPDQARKLIETLERWI